GGVRGPCVELLLWKPGRRQARPRPACKTARCAMSMRRRQRVKRALIAQFGIGRSRPARRYGSVDPQLESKCAAGLRQAALVVEQSVQDVVRAQAQLQL